MKMLCKVRLSEHKYKTPEGYLYCKDAIIARTGKQTYLESEIYEGSTSDDYIEVDRREEEVFSPQTLASFENKPLTIEHPNTSVGPENYRDLAVGHVQNVRRGEYENQPVMMADILVTDAEAIRLIETGEMEELSCGYDCDITDGPNPEQINIRGNHVALCEAGRAGNARIFDSKPWGAQSIQDSVSKGTLIQEFGKQGKQYKIDKIVGNVIYAESLETGKTILFKKDEENIEWAIITKSEVKDAFFTIEEQIKHYIETKAREDFDNDELSQDTFKSWSNKMIVYDLVNWFNRQLTDKEKEIAREHMDYVYKELLPKLEKSKEEDFVEDIEYNRYVKLYDEIEKFLEKYNNFSVKALNSLIRYGNQHDAETIEEIVKSLDYDFEKLRNVASLGERQAFVIADDLIKEGYELKNIPEDLKEKADEVRHKYQKDAKPKKYVIALEEGDYWLDINDKPTSDYKSARKFDSYEEADSHRKSYCKGSVQEFMEDTYIEDDSETKICCICGKEFKGWGNNPWPVKEDGVCCDECNQNEVIPARLEKSNLNDSLSEEQDGKIIKELLKEIKHGDIDASWGSLTIDFENDSDMKKAAEILKDKYDIELLDDEGSPYIAVYDKLTNDSKDIYKGYDLIRGDASKEFKNYLRDRGLYFEPSDNGDFVHFEVKNADEYVDQRVEDIRRHWAKTKDAYSKKFYSKMLKELHEQLDNLEKKEVLDENHNVYEKQKNRLKESIMKQIKEYEAKLK